MSVESILVVLFIIAIVAIFIFSKDVPSEESEEEDYNNRLIITSKGTIKIVKGGIGSNGVGEYFFFLGDFLIEDTSLIGFLWLSIMDENYIDTEEIDLSDFDEAIFGVTSSEEVEKETTVD